VILIEALFWLVVGIFAGLVEIVPVIGPIAAGAVAIGVGLTQSWELALAAGLADDVVGDRGAEVDDHARAILTSVAQELADALGHGALPTKGSTGAPRAPD
jgi:hypothetical protein